MTNAEIATASKIMIGSTYVSAMYIGSEKLWPDLNSNELVEIEYLEGSGYQYIDTSIVPDNMTGIEVTTRPNKNNYQNQNDNYIVGLRDNTSNTRWCLGKSTSNDRCRIYFGVGPFYYFGVNDADENRYYSYGTTFTLSLNFLNDNYAVDKGRSSKSIGSSLSFTPKNVIRIFGASGVNADYTKYSGKIYSVRISLGTQIVLDLIPVRRGNVGYMLDKITGTLYGNNGTSNFILGPDVQHDYVEIGGLRWATMNIGADSVTDIGLFYPWGDAQGYTSYGTGQSWSNYKYGNGTASPEESDITKYNSTDGKTTLDLEDDAARINWGGNWRIPSVREWKSLINNTNLQYTTNYLGSGVNGWLCTDKTNSNKKLFFPVNVELPINGSIYIIGVYWSNLLYIGNKKLAFRTAFRNNSGVFTQETNDRYTGQGVRAVMDYSLDYFTIESLENSNTIRIEKNGSAPNISLSYSTNNGTTWTNLTVSASINLTTIDIGDKIIFKGTNSTLSSKLNVYWRFAPSKNFNVYGNAMSLLFGDNFINNSEFASGTTYNLYGMFYGTTTLINAKNLILPATTLANSCYSYMFNGCTSLTTAPVLPATTLARYCYYYMFHNCTSLTTAPKLPATTLVLRCYSSMFNGCTALTTAPALPATTLADYCYQGMFLYCTSLVTAPSLPATTLLLHCYSAMFNGCTSLSYIKAMFKTTPSSTYTSNWVNGVAATGTFVKNSAATWNVTDTNGIPSGWTVLTSSS